MRIAAMLLSASMFILTAGAASAENATPHNLILFVPDGLRALMVKPETAPAMAEVRDKGVNFKNPHSLFPTFTTANASAMATGHHLGDTGDFSNTIYTGFASLPAGDTVVPFLENDAVLGDVDEHFKGDYLNEETILKLARTQGLSTAAIGKVGPILIFDHTDRADKEGAVHSIVVDDATGAKNGVPLSDEMKEAMTKAGLSLTAPSRGDNGNAGDAKTPGTTTANTAQQAYLTDVATKVVLPMFKARNKPFVLVLWSRDPDGSQHNEGDSLNTITPGINGPTSLAGIRNADDNLAQLRKALDELGLSSTTDIIIADHGFSTISKESKTSPSAKVDYADTPKGFLPMGFLAH
jgi:predicted AlkP superfamily pyrophosphatase or phosphodiesterase